jgi:hypothetical protein
MMKLYNSLSQILNESKVLDSEETQLKKIYNYIENIVKAQNMVLDQSKDYSISKPVVEELPSQIVVMISPGDDLIIDTQSQLLISLENFILWKSNSDK